MPLNRAWLNSLVDEAPPTDVGTTVNKGFVSDFHDVIDAALLPLETEPLPSHAATHAAGGSDPVTLTPSQVVGLTATLADKVSTSDPRLTDARTPTAHASTHVPGGSDALPVDASPEVGSLRTLGTTPMQAAAGNDPR